MDDCIDLLRKAASDGILIYVRDGRLKARAPQGALDDSWKQQIAANKQALLALPSSWFEDIGEEAALDAHAAWWEAQWLAGAAAVLPSTRHAGESGADQRDVVFSTHRAAAVEACAEQDPSQIAQLLMTVFAALLARWGDQDGIVVGVRSTTLLGVRATQWDRGVDPILAINLPLVADATAADLLATSQRVVEQALAHRWLPLRAVPSIAAAAGTAPLFAVGFCFADSGTGTRSIEPEVQHLQLQARLLDGQVHCAWHFDCHRLDRLAVQRLSESFEVLLDGFSMSSDQSVVSLPLLGALDRQQSDACRAPLLPPTFEGGVHDTFSRWAARQPDALALSDGTCRMSYAELDRRSNGVARALVERGVEAGEPVVLCMGRTAYWVVALLGILKAGAAYLPVDPQHPIERLRFVVQDCGARVLVTTSSHAATLDGIAGTLLLADEVAQDTRLNVPGDRVVEPQQTAYLVYTSGSTGQPKGVRLTHAGAANLLSEFQHDFGLGASSRVMQFSSISFDVATLDWIWALGNGASLFICDDVQRQSPEALSDLMVRERITHTLLPPALLAHLDPDRDYALNALIVAGEAMEPSTAWRWAARWPVFNGYGPSEATVLATRSRVVAGEPISIGRPLRNLGARVVDRHGQDLPMGCMGELVIEGIGVGAGYVRRPELDAEKFSGSSDVPMRRQYRSGDLVVLRDDGQIDFLGRIDDQVKIRGFRIELGEINAKLHAIRGVRQAFTMPHGVGAEKRLIGYLAPETWPPPEGEIALANRLRDALALELPEYMLPAGFVFLPALPLNVNGKVDRRALPGPERMIQAGAAYVAPRDATEQALCDVWATLLRLERVGIHDRFFAIGGDSILLIQAVARANQAGIALTARDLHELQSVAAISAHLKTLPDRPVVVRAPAHGRSDLLPIQQAFLATGGEDLAHYNQSMLLHAPADLSLSLVEAMMARLYAQHDALRLRFHQDDAGIWSGWHVDRPAVDLAAESCVQHDAAPACDLDDEALAAVCGHYQTGFSLEHGPLLRAVLLRGETRTHLFLCIHHLVVDGVSWRILLDDLVSMLSQSLGGQPLQLAERTTSHQEWARRLQHHAGSTTIQSEAEFWRRGGLATAPALPQDHPVATPVLEESSAYLPIELDECETSALIREAAASYRTGIQELLVAAVYLALARWSGQWQHCLEMESHGREPLFEDIDLSRTVGWFTTTYPLHLDLQSEHADSGSVVRMVKEALRAIPRNGIGHGLLARHDSGLGDQAKPQVLFNYLGTFEHILGTPNGQGFTLAMQSTGRAVGPRRPRAHLLSFNAVTTAGRIRIGMDYSAEQFDAATMTSLGGLVKEVLLCLAGEGARSAGQALTPSDFPLASLDAATLKRWQERYAPLHAIYPATPMQKGMLFHTLMRSDAYVTQVWPLFRGPLEPDRLHQAWQAVAAKYAIFRTAFAGELDTLHQVVMVQAAIGWHFEDWSTLSAPEQEAAFAAYRHRDRLQGFDVTRAPLQRITLVRLAKDRHYMLWTHHHMLLDGWCLPLVHADLMQAYAQLAKGRAVLQEEVPYEHYIGWLLAQDADTALRWWKEELQSVTLPTPLCLPGPAAAGQDAAAAVTLLDATLDEAQTARLLAFAQSHELTPFTLLQLAWAATLHAASGLSEVVFGATVSGRPAEVQDVERMVGLFINTIPVKVRLDPTLSLADTGRAIQNRYVQATRHGHVPLAQIQKHCRPTGTGRLFDSVVVFENYPLDAVAHSDALAGLTVESVGSEQETNYAVTVSAHLTRRMEIRLACREAELSVPAQALLDALLQQLAGVPDNRLVAGRLALEPAAGPAAPGFVDTCDEADESVLTMIGAAVARDPSGTAATGTERALSRGELWRLSGQLAADIADEVRASAAPVAILMHPSPEFVVAVLAVLRAGGAYLPLDPGYPDARLRSMLDDAKPSLVLSSSLCADHGALADTRPLNVDTWLTQLHAGGAVPTIEPEPDALAYVIYTSGSTGRPKGVQITHRALANLAARMVELLDLGSHDRVLQFTPCSFDVSVQEIFSALVAGASLHFLPVGYPRVGSQLVDFMRNAAITVATMPPAVLTTVAPDNLPDLRMIVTGAEPIAEGVVREWGQGRGFCYQYGPTETCVTVTATHCSVGQGTPGIGRPLGNTRLHVVDEQLRLVPFGEVGELLIGGAGVARGYLAAPAATAQAFVPDAYSGEPGLRLYRTGDLVRYRRNGELEFVGRNDDQVKLRGVRIELGDVEAALLGHPRVRHAAALVTGSTGQDRRLVAYVQVDDPQDPDLVPELRAHMQSRLAPHMRPAAIVAIEQFAVNVNGKIDKSLLPVPFFTTDADSGMEGERMERIAAIFAAVIGVSGLQPDANFFDEGGDSLLAVKAIARINEQLGTDGNVALIFQAPTPRLLAQLLPEAPDADALEALLREIDAMSDEEAQQLLNTSASTVQ